MREFFRCRLKPPTSSGKGKRRGSCRGRNKIKKRIEKKQEKFLKKDKRLKKKTRIYICILPRGATAEVLYVHALSSDIYIYIYTNIYHICISAGPEAETDKISRDKGHEHDYDHDHDTET
jgi:hypothetical protein